MNGKQQAPSERWRWGWLGLWCVSWIGIISGFLMVGVFDFSHESTKASSFFLALMTVTSGAWIVFFVADSKIRKRIDGEKNWAAMVDLLTLTGTLLAAFTLLGIGFFVYVAPNLR